MHPFVLIIGPAQHGKSTYRKALAAALGTRGGSCSDAIYALWAYLDGKRGPEVLRELPKEEVRPKLVALGDWLTTDAPCFSTHFPREAFPEIDPTQLDRTGLPRPSAGALIQYAFQDGVRVLDGVRRKRELEGARPFFSWFGVEPIVVWVEDPRKPRIATDNLDLTWRDAHTLVSNRSSVEALEESARLFAEEILGKSESDA